MYLCLAGDLEVMKADLVGDKDDPEAHVSPKGTATPWFSSTGPICGISSARASDIPKEASNPRC